MKISSLMLGVHIVSRKQLRWKKITSCVFFGYFSIRIIYYFEIYGFNPCKAKREDNENTFGSLKFLDGKKYLGGVKLCK